MSTIEKKSLQVGKYVDNDHVDSLIRTYKQERWAFNTERLGKEDSLSVWYSAEELEGFIEQLKEHGGNGVRIYFGTYPENYKGVPEYAGRQTLVMVATKTKHIEDRLSHKEVYVTENGKPKILAYNNGAMCPPFCTNPPGTGQKNVPLGVTLVDNGDKGFSVV